MTGSALAGLRIVVTRPRHQADSFATALERAGAQVIRFPAIAIRPVEDTTILDRALTRLACYDWLVLTSVNGVEMLWERLESLGIKSLPPGLRVAAIGPKTAAALREKNTAPNFVPDEYIAEAIVPGLGDLRGAWVLLPRADLARPALADAIRAAGGFPHDIAAYRTAAADPDSHALKEIRQGVDVITFTSSSTVRNFLSVLEEQGIDLAKIGGGDGAGERNARGPVIACIGPITAETAREAGLVVDVVAEVYTIEGLIAGLEKYWQTKNLQTGSQKEKSG